MTVLPILTGDEPILHQRTPEMSLDELASAEVQELIDDLIETRRAAGGAGLAAPQVGAFKRVAVVSIDDATRYSYKPPFPLTVIVNPVIKPVSEERLLINEGCLSLPDQRGDVWRALDIEVLFLDRFGEQVALTVSGLTAGTFQHEVDHLDGTLFVDRAEPGSLTSWKEFEQHGQEAFLQRVAPYVRGAGT